MDKIQKIVTRTVFGCTWFANIYDLTMGVRFFPTTSSVIFGNIFGLVALYLIISGIKEEEQEKMRKRKKKK